MRLDSPLEMYTTLFGWSVYNSIWSLIAMVGLPTMVLGWMILTEWQEAKEQSSGMSDAAARSRNAVYVKGITIMAVILLAGLPITTMRVNSLSYEVPCYGDGNSAFVGVSADDDAITGAGGGGPGSTGTLLDAPFAAATQAQQVPLWWHLVMKISAGINTAAIQAIGCTRDLSFEKRAVDRDQIDNTGLVEELDTFVGACYEPARAAAHRKLAPDSPALSAENDWIGGGVYAGGMEFAPFYDAMQPLDTYPIVTWQPSLDNPIDATLQAQPNPPAWGTPQSCAEWWNGGDLSLDRVGLRERLLNEVERGTLEHFYDVMTGRTEREVEDILIKRLIVSETLTLADNSDFLGAEYGEQGILGNLTRMASGYGALKEYGSLMFQLETLKPALPMIKAFFIMLIYASMAVLLFLGGYRLGSVLIITAGVVAVQFLSVIWHLAWFLEQSLIASLWPDTADFVAALANGAVGGDYGLKRLILSIVVAGLYIFMPLMFLTIVGWAGIKVGSMVPFGGSMTGAAMVGGAGGRAAASGLRAAGRGTSKRISDGRPLVGSARHVGSRR